MIPRPSLKSGLSGWTDKSNLETMDLLSSVVRFCFLLSRRGGASQCSGGGRSMVTSYHQNMRDLSFVDEKTDLRRFKLIRLYFMLNMHEKLISMILELQDVLVECQNFSK